MLNGFSEVQDYANFFMNKLYDHSSTGRKTATLMLEAEGFDRGSLRDRNAIKTRYRAGWKLSFWRSCGPTVETAPLFGAWPVRCATPPLPIISK